MRLLITRAEPDATTMKTAVEALGHDGVIEPLLSIEYGDCDPIELGGVQALIATSRNALRALAAGSNLEDATRLPLFVVGPNSAAMALQMGFTSVSHGPGRAAGLVPLIVDALDAGEGMVLHLAGADLAVDIAGPLKAAGFRIAQPIVYKARPATRLSSSTLSLLRTGKIDGVIVMSPRTAGIFAALITNAGLAETPRDLVYFCLSDAVAAGLKPLTSLNTKIAAQPNKEKMLALIADSTENLR